MRKNFQVLHVILFAIIVLNVLDFFELLDPFWDYVKKVVSWFLVGLVFDRVSPSHLILGRKSRFLDFSFVLGAFALTINDMLRYAELMRAYMLENARSFVTLFQDSGTPSVVVTLSQEAFNSLSIFGVVPDITSHMSALASELTLTNALTHVGFEFAGEQIVYAVGPYGLSGSLLAMYNSLFPHIGAIEQWGLISGMVVLLIVALIATLRFPVGEKSMLGLIDKGEAHGSARLLARFVLCFLVYFLFFLFLFSLVMEWLAIAIDAPILMIAILFSIVLAHSHKARFDFTRWEQFVTGFGDVTPLMNLFRNKRTILLAISGVLVLHVLTEILNYLLPFALPLRDHLYLAQLGAGHENIFTYVSGVPEIIVAVLNLFAWLCIFAIPGYIWYKIYKLRGENHEQHHPRFPPWFLAIFSASLYVMLLSRMIWFKKLGGPGLVGVDFYTQASSNFAMPLLLVGLGIAVLVFFLAQFSIRPFLYLIPLGASLIFLAVYAYLFFMSSSEYYLLLVLGAISAGFYTLSAIFALFLVLTGLFYGSGFVLFVYEILRD